MHANETSQPVLPDRILRRREVLELIGLSEPTLWRLEKRGAFPRAIKLTVRLVGYREADVRRWLAARPSTVA